MASDQPSKTDKYLKMVGVGCLTLAATAVVGYTAYLYNEYKKEKKSREVRRIRREERRIKYGIPKKAKKAKVEKKEIPAGFEEDELSEKIPRMLEAMNTAGPEAVGDEEEDLYNGLMHLQPENYTPETRINIARYLLHYQGIKAYAAMEKQDEAALQQCIENAKATADLQWTFIDLPTDEMDEQTLTIMAEIVLQGMDIAKLVPIYERLIELEKAGHQLQPEGGLGVILRVSYHLGKWDRYVQTASQIWGTQELMNMHATAVERPEMGFDHAVLIEMARGPTKSMFANMNVNDLATIEYVVDAVKMKLSKVSGTSEDEDKARAALNDAADWEPVEGGKKLNRMGAVANMAGMPPYTVPLCGMMDSKNAILRGFKEIVNPAKGLANIVKEEYKLQYEKTEGQHEIWSGVLTMKNTPASRGGEGPKTELTFDVSLKLLGKPRPPMGSSLKKQQQKSTDSASASKAKLNGSN